MCGAGACAQRLGGVEEASVRALLYCRPGPAELQLLGLRAGLLLRRRVQSSAPRARWDRQRRARARVPGAAPLPGAEEAGQGQHGHAAPHARGARCPPPEYRSPKEAALWGKACQLLREAISCCEWCPWGREAGDVRAPPTTAPLPPTDAELHALLSRLDSNCFGCFRCDGGPTIGHGCFLAAAVFNHSCDPNCFATSGASTLRIETQQAVAQG